MFPSPGRHHSQLELFLLIIVGLITCVGIHGQAKNRDQVRAIQRAEMDRLLLFATPTNKDSESTRLALLKEIKDDFRDMQALNNKMMADAWAQEALDYAVISDMVSRIRGKATRLKLNLQLPESNSAEKPAEVGNVATAREFRSALLTLDKTIMRFVTNPLFQVAHTFEVGQARKAQQDLEDVISLAADLKKTASKLGKTSIAPH